MREAKEEAQKYMVKRGSYNFACLSCNHTAKQLPDILRHIEAIHLNINIPCQYCEKGDLGSSLAWSKHMRKFHREPYQEYLDSK